MWEEQQARSNDLAATSLRTFNITLTLISEPRAYCTTVDRSIPPVPSLPLFTDSYSVLMVSVEEMCAVSPVMAFHKSLRIPLLVSHNLRLSKQPCQFYGCGSVFLIVRFQESGFLKGGPLQTFVMSRVT